MTSNLTRTTAILAAAATLAGGLAAPAALADEATGAGAGQTQDATDARQRLGQAVERAGKVDVTRDWNTGTDAFSKALEQARAVGQDADEATVTAAASRLEQATEALLDGGTKATVARDKALKAAEPYLDSAQKPYYPDDATRKAATALATLGATHEETRAGDEKLTADAAALDAAIKAMADANLTVSAYQTARKAGETERARGLNYSDETGKAAAEALDAALDASVPDSSHQSVGDNKARQSAADAINDALGKLGEAQGDETKSHADALAAAKAKAAIQKDKDGKAYTADSYAPLAALLDDGFDPSTATAAELREHTDRLTRATAGLTVASWSVDGQTLTVRDGTLTGLLKTRDKAMDAPVLTGSDGSTIALTDTAGGFTQDADTLGVGHVTHTLAGTTTDAAALPVSVAYAVTTGSETTATLKDANGEATGRFTRGDDGAWTASLTGRLGVGSDASAAASETVTLSDGTELKGELSATESKGVNGTTLLTRTLTATGTDSHGTTVHLTATLSYTYDPNVNLTLTHSHGSQDTPATVALPGLDGDVDAGTLKDSYTTAVQPRDTMGDAWTLNVKHGPNVRDATIAAETRDDGSRILVATIPYDRLGADGHTLVAATRIVRVNVPIEAAPTVVGNDEAALAGIKVNGRDIPGFSADKVDYVITAGLNERVRVSPVAKPGQTVSAGDSRQTAFTTVQTWTVSKDGQTRVYTVTLVRDHTEKTADEAFTPSEPVGNVSTADNPGADNVKLESVGYMLDGEYHAAKGTTFDIPEGGVLSWMSYAGQVVQPTVTREHGMTFRYELGVLSADGTKYGTTVATVTYITRDTHRAALTGLKVDNVAVAGFDPAKTSYDVRVDNPQRYVVTPSWDRLTGMSIVIHKDETRATVTVTSADGLTSVAYTVNVSAALSPSATLAATGVGVGFAGLTIELLAAAFLALRSRRRVVM